MTKKTKSRTSNKPKSITIEIPATKNRAAKKHAAQKIIITHPSKKELKTVTEKVIKQYKQAIKKLSRS